jgi:hypothetical protein
VVHICCKGEKQVDVPAENPFGGAPLCGSGAATGVGAWTSGMVPNIRQQRGWIQKGGKENFLIFRENEDSVVRGWGFKSKS